MPVTEVYTPETALLKIAADVASAYPACNVDSLFKVTGIAAMIIPDLVYDQQTTDLVHEESMDFISPTMGVVKTGQVIVSNGEIVTAEIDDRSIDQYHPYAEEVIGRDSILQAMRASGVVGNVASDRAGKLRGRVWRIEEAVLRHHRRYAQICDSRFDADEAVIVVDREHPIHL